MRLGPGEFIPDAGGGGDSCLVQLFAAILGIAMVFYLPFSIYTCARDVRKNERDLATEKTAATAAVVASRTSPMTAADSALARFFTASWQTSSHDYCMVLGLNGSLTIQSAGGRVPGTWTVRGENVILTTAEQTMVLRHGKDSYYHNDALFLLGVRSRNGSIVGWSPSDPCH